MLKLGIAQLEVAEGKIEENYSHIEEVICAHKDDGIDLLCFPELCISGYDYKAAAASENEETCFCELAKKYKQAILAGIHTIHEGKHYDVNCIWDENGVLLGEYRKIHLWDTENEFFEKGDELVTVEFKDWTIGLLICADFGFAEISTPLAGKGAELIIYPSAWGKGWEELFVTCSKMRAAENQVYTVALNRASCGGQYCGNSAVSNPDGTTLARLQTEQEAFMIVELEKEKLEEARKGICWNSMKRPEVYERLKEETYVR